MSSEKNTLESEAPLNALEYLCRITGTEPADWEEMVGPDSGVGLDFWFINTTNEEQWYVNVDQGEYTATRSQIEDTFHENTPSDHPELRTVRVFLDDGTDYVTSVNGSVPDDQIRKYFVGQRFDMGPGEARTWRDMKLCTNIEFLEAMSEPSTDGARSIVEAVVPNDREPWSKMNTVNAIIGGLTQEIVRNPRAVEELRRVLQKAPHDALIAIYDANWPEDGGIRGSRTHHLTP